jgi:UDP-glucose 4-epimerase
MDTQTILVTGGTGYIGSHTVVELINAGYQVVIIDNLSNSKDTVVDAIAEITGTRPAFHQVDLLDKSALAKVFSEHQIDAVMHFAGLKAVAESVAEPLKYYETNVGGTVNLLEAMRTAGVKRVVFSSTACVYGEQASVQYVETMTVGVGIANPYGWTKFAVEAALNNLAASDPDWQVSILRYFNPVGNHPSGLIGEDPNGIPNNLMPIVMKVATGEQSELKVFGDDYPTPDGTCIRDFIHVVDLAKGHLAALDHLQPGIGTYNLGSGHGTSVQQIIDAFERATGKPLPHVIAPRRPGDLPEYYADPAKANTELGWHTALTIDDAMRDTIKFLQYVGKLPQ